MWGCGDEGWSVWGRDVGNSRGSDLELYQKTMLTFGAWLCICACVLSHLVQGLGEGTVEGRQRYLPACKHDLFLPNSGLLGKGCMEDGR